MNRGFAAACGIAAILLIVAGIIVYSANQRGGLKYVFTDYSTTYDAEVACQNQTTRVRSIDDQVYGCRQVIREYSNIDTSLMTMNSIDSRKRDVEEAKAQLEKIKAELEKRGIQLTAE